MCEWYWFAKERKVILLAPHGVHQLQNRRTPWPAWWEFNKDPDAIVETSDEVCAHYNVVDDCITLFCTSEGAQMALSVASRMPGKAGYVGLYGEDWTPDMSKRFHVNLDGLAGTGKRMHVFLGRGANDRGFRVENFQLTIMSLRKFAMDVKGIAAPGLEHDDRSFRQVTLLHHDEVYGRSTAKPGSCCTLTGT